jgi:hypothetical protein
LCGMILDLLNAVKDVSSKLLVAHRSVVSLNASVLLRYPGWI